MSSLAGGSGGGTVRLMPGSVASASAMPRCYSHAERMRVVIGTLICVFLAAIDQTVIVPALPQVGATLHSGGGSLSWMVSAYLLTSTASTPIYGQLSDQLGRRALLMPAILLFGLASAMCALSHALAFLVASRALQGLGGGGLVAITQAAIADVIPPRERGRYQGWIAGTWGIASIAGPAVGGLVAGSLSWRWLFWANIPIGALAFALCWRGLAVLPARHGRARIDYAGAILLTSGVTCLLFGLSSIAAAANWGGRGVLPPMLAGLFLLGVFALQQKRAAAPLLPAGLFSASGYRQIVCLGSLISASMFSGIFLLRLSLQWVHLVSPWDAGLDIIPFMAVNALGALTAGRVFRRSGRTRPLLLTGPALSAAGFLWIALLPAGSSIWATVVLSGIAGFGIGLVMPTSLVVAQNGAPPHAVGVATGVLLLLRSIGGASGATLAGALLSSSPQGASLHAFDLGFAACGVLCILAAIVAWRMPEVHLRNKPAEDMPHAPDGAF